MEPYDSDNQEKRSTWEKGPYVRKEKKRNKEIARACEWIPSTFMFARWVGGGWSHTQSRDRCHARHRPWNRDGERSEKPLFLSARRLLMRLSSHINKLRLEREGPKCGILSG